MTDLIERKKQKEKEKKREKESEKDNAERTGNQPCVRQPLFTPTHLSPLISKNIIPKFHLTRSNLLPLPPNTPQPPLQALRNILARGITPAQSTARLAHFVVIVRVRVPGPRRSIADASLADSSGAFLLVAHETTSTRATANGDVQVASRARLHLNHGQAFLRGVVAMAVAARTTSGLVVFELLLNGVRGLALAFEVVGVVLLDWVC